MNTPEKALTRLARLAARARDSAEEAAADRAARNEAIGDLFEQGMGVREIARATGPDPGSRLAVGHIHRIVAEQVAARQKRALEAIP